MRHSGPVEGGGAKWGCKNAPDVCKGVPVIARGVSKSGHQPGRPDFVKAPCLGHRPRVQHRQSGNYWKRGED